MADVDKHIPTCFQQDQLDLISVMKEQPGSLKDAAGALNPPLNLLISTAITQLEKNIWRE